MKLPPAGAVHDEREIEAVVAVMRDNPKLEIGDATLALEERVAAKLSKRFGLMVNSGSSALRIAIDLLGLEAGDEIITSPLTFSTDVAPMVQSGLVPVFADITADTYQIDTGAVEEMIGSRTRAILVPNLCGNCPDWDKLRAVADSPRPGRGGGLLRRARQLPAGPAHRRAQPHQASPASPAPTP